MLALQMLSFLLSLLPHREAIGDIDKIEKDDTAKENINIEERGAHNISVEATHQRKLCPILTLKINRI